MIDMDELHLRTKALEQAVINARQREQGGASYPSDEDIVATTEKFITVLRG